MSDTTQNWYNKPTYAAAAGATAALVMAMFTPAAVILGIGGAVAAGTYLWKKSGDKDRQDGAQTTKQNKEAK